MASTALDRSLCYWKGQVSSHSETVQKLSWGHQEPPGGVSSPLNRKTLGIRLSTVIWEPPCLHSDEIRQGPGSPPLLRRTGCVGYISQEKPTSSLTCSLHMDLMIWCPLSPPIKEKGVWWGERDKRHTIIFWLVLTLGQAGQLMSNEFSKP